MQRVDWALSFDMFENISKTINLDVPFRITFLSFLLLNIPFFLYCKRDGNDCKILMDCIFQYTKLRIFYRGLSLVFTISSHPLALLLQIKYLRKEVLFQELIVFEILQIPFMLKSYYYKLLN